MRCGVRVVLNFYTCIDTGVKFEAMINPEDPARALFETKTHAPEQRALFSTEDLVIPQSVLTIKKAVSAIHTYPDKDSPAHTLNTRRLFDACVLVAQMDIRARKGLTVERIRSERISPIFEVGIGDLAELAGASGKNYQRLYDELDVLFRMVMHWNIVGEDSSVAWNMKSHFLSSLGTGVNAKRGQVRFSMDPEILAILLEPSNWATLSMQVLKSLKGGGAAHALYQNTFRYLGTEKKVTAQLSVQTWLSLLVGPSRYVFTDDKTGEQSINYKDAKRYVLLPAIEQINSHPALNYTLDMHERKSGNRVVALQFSFKAKKQAVLDLPMSWSSEILSVLGAMGFGDSAISDMSQAHGQDQIVEALNRLDGAKNALRSKGRKIGNLKSYFLGILENIHAEFSVADDAERLEVLAAQQSAEAVARDRRQKLEEDFAQFQAQSYARAFMALDGAKRDALIGRFAVSESGASLVGQRFIAQGWGEHNKKLIAIFRSWAKEAEPQLEGELLALPQERSFDEWMHWRLLG